MSEYQKVVCFECNKKFTKITNTHLKLHNLSKNDYKRKYPNAIIEDKQLALDRQSHKRGKTYKEIYGSNNGNFLIRKRRMSAKKQMLDINQINIRKEKCGYEQTKERRLHQTIIKTKHGGSNYRKRALEYYGSVCNQCRSKKNIIVHHKHCYNDMSFYGNHSLDELEVLCKSCHAKLHNKKIPGQFKGISKIEKGIINIMKHIDILNVPNNNIKIYKENLLNEINNFLESDKFEEFYKRRKRTNC